MTTTLVRPAAAADAPAVVALLGVLGHAPRALAHVAARLATPAPGTVVLVADADDRVVGVIAATVVSVLEYVAPQLRVSVCAVDPGARRVGVGSALVRAVEDEAATRGCFRVELTSAHVLADGHAFWAARGYRDAGVRFVRELATL